MALVTDPLNRRRTIRVNDRYDNQDMIVENSLSQKKKYRNLPRVDQLTQNSWNHSRRTQEDVYKDVTAIPGKHLNQAGKTGEENSFN